MRLAAKTESRFRIGSWPKTADRCGTRPQCSLQTPFRRCRRREFGRCAMSDVLRQAVAGVLDERFRTCIVYGLMGRHVAS